MSRRGAVLLCVLIYVHTTMVTALSAGTGHVFGIWVVRDALESQERIDELIKTAREIGVTSLFIQVNGRGWAYFSSDVLPPARELAPGFDPLDYVVRRCREAGIKVHAWINVFTVGSFLYKPGSPVHVINRHPEWITYDHRGRSLIEYTLEQAKDAVPAPMLDPGIPAVQEFIMSYVRELVFNYDIDGIHLDYIRYPGPQFGYSPVSRKRFEQLHGYDPLELPGTTLRLLWDTWRRRQVTELVARVHNFVDRHKPLVELSAAVIPEIEAARDYYFQDWVGWLNEGLIDFAVLMAYDRDTGVVTTQASAAIQAVKRGRVYIGIGAYRMLDNPGLVMDKIETLRDMGIPGILLFSYNTLSTSPVLLNALQRINSY